jgi:activator of 2-hydroxyglutaryl-CoA dehydratase
MFEGWNIGSVTIKRVRLTGNGSLLARTVRHGGDPRRGFLELIQSDRGAAASGVCVTGPLASSTFALPYLPEPICIEAGLVELGVRPDLVLSLGGESFVIYFVQEGTVRGMVSTTRCAAGSGEFLVQQLGRLGFDLERGISEAERGQIIKLASRCSVHCKSDSTHKLNKGECTAADVARSVIRDLAQKVFSLTASSGWSRREAVVIGGLSQNRILLADLRQIMVGTNLRVLEQSPYLEAFGAAVAPRPIGGRPRGPQKHLR